MLNLGYEAEVVRVFEADTLVGAGAGDETDIIDMAGYEAVAFLVVVGDIGAAGLTVTAQQSDDAFVADEDDLEDGEVTIADADDDLVAIIDIGKPAKRYVRLAMVPGANDCDVDAVIALKYRARNVPVTQGATVVETVVLATPAAV